MNFLVVVVPFWFVICVRDPIVLQSPWELIMGRKVDFSIKDCPDLCAPVKVEVRYR